MTNLINGYSGVLPSGIDDNAASDKGVPLGTLIIDVDNVKKYRRVKVKTGITVAINSVVYHDATNYWTVTNSLSSIGRNHVAGVAQNALTALYYGYVQTHGAATPLKATTTNTGFAVSDIAVPSSTATLVAVVAAGTAPTYRVVGWYHTAANSAAGTVPIYLVLD